MSRSRESYCELFRESLLCNIVGSPCYAIDWVAVGSIEIDWIAGEGDAIPLSPSLRSLPSPSHPPSSPSLAIQSISIESIAIQSIAMQSIAI